MFALGLIVGGFLLGALSLVVAVEMHRGLRRGPRNPEDAAMVRALRRRAETARISSRRVA